MKKIATLTALGLATALAGCTGSAYSNRSLESVHQPLVRNATYHFDVAATNGDLPPSEQGRLEGWLDAMGARYGDRIAVEDSSTYGAAAAQATQDAAQPAPTAADVPPAGRQLGWDDVDADGNGTISREESAALPALASVFDQADADGDGELTADEYRAHAAKAGGEG